MVVIAAAVADLLPVPLLLLRRCPLLSCCPLKGSSAQPHLLPGSSTATSLLRLEQRALGCRRVHRPLPHCCARRPSLAL